MSNARRARQTESRDFGVAVGSAALAGLACIALWCVWMMTRRWDVVVVAGAGCLLAGCAGAILFIRDPNKVMFDTDEREKLT